MGLCMPLVGWADPCPDEVVEYVTGFDGGFNADQLPGIVLGPPVGGGESRGSTDVVSLGDGGVITLFFRDNEIVDGPGPDFTIFENPFFTGSPLPFIEAGFVSVSQDGVSFVTFPYSASSFDGLAGVRPVYANPTNGIDPRSPAAGGDAFDLAAVGLSSARYVRITDAGEAVPDPGNAFPVIGRLQSGVDLDGMIATSSRDVCSSCCDADGDGQVSAADVALLLAHVGGRPPATALCGQAPCRPTDCGDPSNDREITTTDVRTCLRGAIGLPVECAGGLCDAS